MYEFVTTCVHFDASATLYFPFFSLHKYVCLVLWYIIMNAAMGVCHEGIHPSGSPARLYVAIMSTLIFVLFAGGKMYILLFFFFSW